jgi:50S ribosomal subunit-associated GTPase HflX
MEKFNCNKLINQLYIRVPLRSQTRETRHRHVFAHVPFKTNAGKRALLYKITKLENLKFSDTDIFATSPGLFKKNLIQVVKTLQVL